MRTRRCTIMHTHTYIYNTITIYLHYNTLHLHHVYIPSELLVKMHSHFIHVTIAIYARCVYIACTLHVQCTYITFALHDIALILHVTYIYIPRALHLHLAYIPRARRSHAIHVTFLRLRLMRPACTTRIFGLRFRYIRITTA